MEYFYIMRGAAFENDFMSNIFIGDFIPSYPELFYLSIVL